MMYTVTYLYGIRQVWLQTWSLCSTWAQEYRRWDLLFATVTWWEYISRHWEQEYRRWYILIIFSRSHSNKSCSCTHSSHSRP